MNKIKKKDEKIIGSLVSEATEHYFKNNEHRRAFEEWYRATYGKTYKWKGVIKDGTLR